MFFAAAILRCDLNRIHMCFKVSPLCLPPIAILRCDLITHRKLRNPTVTSTLHPLSSADAMFIGDRKAQGRGLMLM